MSMSTAPICCGGLLSAPQASDTLAVSVALKATPDMTHKLSKYLVPQQQVHAPGLSDKSSVTLSMLNLERVLAIA